MAVKARNFGDNLAANVFTFANTASESDTIDLNGTTPIGIYVPDEWATAKVTLLASPAPLDVVDILPVPLYKAAVMQTIDVTAGVITTLLPVDWLCGVYRVKLISGTPSVRVAQNLNNKPVILLSRPV